MLLHIGQARGRTYATRTPVHNATNPHLSTIPCVCLCSPLSQLLQLAPILILLFISLFSFPSETERAFSLHRSEKYMTPRQTSVEQVHSNTLKAYLQIFESKSHIIKST